MKRKLRKPGLETFEEKTVVNVVQWISDNGVVRRGGPTEVKIIYCLRNLKCDENGLRKIYLNLY